MMELFTFQENASTQIANRFKDYMLEPARRVGSEIVPFYQNLAAITGAGKTIILADIISQIRMQLPIEPIVLWISKGKVVVWQTYVNLSTGKYSDLVGSFKVMPLSECSQLDIEQANEGLILLATVGKFNQKDMEKGDRRIFQPDWDNADDSLWNLLRERTNTSGIRRPLIIVYDEGHNFSNQQTELLLKLQPYAIISASATMRVSEAMNKRVISRIMDDKGWSQQDFITAVKSSDVVKKGLIKQHISLGGYVTPMEVAVSELIDDFNNLEKIADDYNLGFKPKAIYVSNTNMVVETGEKDRINIPFDQREARPIQIWRYLVNEKKVDPDKIAVYCDLKFDSAYPPPATFHLFSGGDNDYDNFVSGDYQHIIFNLTLQEGWDDPCCYFAYIDKDMSSKDQITQIVGRVLRQPGVQHYNHVDLNTAHFYIRTDDKHVFEQVIEDVKNKITEETPEVTLTVYKGKSSEKNSSKISPRKLLKLPNITTNCENAVEPIKRIVDLITDYRSDTQGNTVGIGSKIKVLQTIASNKSSKDQWIQLEHTNKVTARFVFKRELQKFYSKVVNLCATEEPKFDALIEYNSRAAENIIKSAHDVVKAYVDFSVVTQNPNHNFTVSDVYIDPLKEKTFKYSLHPKYSDFNNFELDFAHALDEAKNTWLRNPKSGCFSIPLLDVGDTNNFVPDFIVWANKSIYAIDTKGAHLIAKDSTRKLLDIEKLGKGADLYIRLVTEGEWNQQYNQIGQDGYTVWKLKNGKVQPFYAITLKDCVHLCITS